MANPVDLAGVGEQDPLSYGRGVETLLTSSEVDLVLVTGYFGGYAIGSGSLAEKEIAAAHDLAARVRSQPKPVVAQSIFPESPSNLILRAAGIPVYRGSHEAAYVLAALVEDRRPTRRAAVELPPAATPLSDFGYDSIRSLLAEAGVAFPSSALVTSESAAIEASRNIGFPLVLKAMGLVHKSDAGGVLLGISDRAELVDGYRDLVSRLNPPSISVEQMASTTQGVELIVGAQHDERFGSVVMVGLGGVFTEVLDDVAFALAPVSAEVALEMVESLRGAPVLHGVRGRASVDLGGLCEVIARISDVGARHPEISELEVNPVLVTPSGAIALDARAIPRVGSAADHGVSNHLVPRGTER